jgi:hypothetical protein
MYFLSRTCHFSPFFDSPDFFGARCESRLPSRPRKIKKKMKKLAEGEEFHGDGDGIAAGF